DAWPPGASVLIDDASLMATSSANVRIQPSYLNMCNGASFRTIDFALQCLSGGGGLLLITAGVYEGPVVLDKGVTMCASTVTRFDCVDNLGTVKLSGGGATVLRLTAPAAGVRGFVIENPDYTEVGDVDPALVSVEADYVSVTSNTFGAPAANLMPGESRHSTTAIRVLPGNERFVIASNSMRSLPTSLALGATCTTPPCMTYGVDAPGPGGNKSSVRTNYVDLTSAPRSIGLHIGSNGTAIVQNTVITAGQQSSSAVDSVGIQSAEGTWSAWDVRGNTIRDAKANAPHVARGIEAALVDSHITTNQLSDLQTGFHLLLGGGQNVLTRNTIERTDQALRTEAPRTSILNNSFLDNLESVVLSAGSTGATMHNNTITATQVADKAVSFTADANGIALDARENDWGVYTRAGIRALIDDKGTGNSVDESCYIDSDHQARVCPPLSDFFQSPVTPKWREATQFVATPTSMGRAVASYSWDFGDGGNSTQREPIHAFALPGTYAATLTVTDADGYSGSVTHAIDVTNTAPSLTPIGDRMIGENQTYSFRVSATDAENDPLNFTANNLPPGATFDAVNATFAWQPGFEQAGNWTGIHFEVTDGNLGASEDINVTVGQANAPPTIEIIGSLYGREASLFTFDVHASDTDGDAIRLSGFVRPQGATFVDHLNGTATFSWTPTYIQAGTYAFTIQASDGRLYPQVTVALTVWNVDRAPTFTPKADVYAGEMDHVAFAVSAVDEDGDTLTYSMKNAPPGATFDAGKRTFQWTPSYTQAGPYAPRFNVTDGNLTHEVVVGITVWNTDRAPVFVPVPAQTTRWNQTLTVTFSATDPDNDPLFLTLLDATPGVNLDGLRLTWRPTSTQTGPHNVTLGVTDGNLTAPGYLVVNVTANAAPIVALDVPARVDVLASVTLRASAIDPDAGGVLRYYWDFDTSNGPSVDAVGTSPTYRSNDVGERNLSLRVTDADGVFTIVNFTILVDDAIFIEVHAEKTYHPTSSQPVNVQVRDWRGIGVPNVTLHVVASYEPVSGAPGIRLREMTVTTDERGHATFFITPDGVFVNIPGRHVATVTASLPDSYLGDTETATGADEYATTR
ncbi:MAG: putative Ig domain-containing protein, partial [Candidatus Thermoplasmatota archaeon]